MYTQAVSSNRTSFWTGRSTTDCLLRRSPFLPSFWLPRHILTLLTSPSWSIVVSVTLPKRHSFLGSPSSLSISMSPICRFVLEVCQRCLVAMLARYSFRQRLQNYSARYWIWRHLFWAYLSSLTNLPGGGKAVTDFIVSKWLGVSGSRLFGSLRLSTVSGRLFTIAIAS